MQPTLVGRHVRLEPLRLRHAPELWPAASRDVRTWDYMVFDVRTIADLDAWIQARLDAQVAGTAEPFLVRDAAGRAVGSTSLFDIDERHKRGEVGHTWLDPTVRRSSINSEAKLLMLRHAFETRGLERVQLKTDDRNTLSQAAIERIGGQREGALRHFQVLPDGAPRTPVMYSILRAEWPAVRKSLEAKLAAHA